MRHSDTEHNHDCFVAAVAHYKLLRIKNERVGFFLYVDDNDAQIGDPPADYHFRGNTAFASGVFVTLIKSVLKDHVPGQCDHCDRVARGLRAALSAFGLVMTTGRETTC